MCVDIESDVEHHPHLRGTVLVVGKRMGGCEYGPNTSAKSNDLRPRRQDGKTTTLSIPAYTPALLTSPPPAADCGLLPSRNP